MFLYTHKVLSYMFYNEGPQLHKNSRPQKQFECNNFNEIKNFVFYNDLFSWIAKCGMPFARHHLKAAPRLKSRCVQGLAFVQITFEKCTTNFYFENGKVGIKMATVNLQPLLALKRFHLFIYFYAASFSIKTCFYETDNAFYLE